MRKGSGKPREALGAPACPFPSLTGLQRRVGLGSANRLWSGPDRKSCRLYSQTTSAAPALGPLGDEEPHVSVAL